MTKQPRGFIALMSAVVISAILLLLMVALSTTGWFGRMNALDRVEKAISDSIAQSCIEEVRLRIASNENYYDTSAETLTVGRGICTTGTSTPLGASISKTLTIQSNFNNFISNIRVIINTIDGSVISMQELGHL